MGKEQEESMSNPFIPKHVKLHALTRAEEESCFKELKANALETCQLPIKDFVECSKEHNVTVMFTCRSLLKTMNNCLKERTSDEELDQLKLKKLSEKLAQQ